MTVESSDATASTPLRPMLVGEIAGQFVVPSYQRGYRWGIDEVTCLLQDITESEGPYYLQPLVVKATDDGWELIDGQQRLTTLRLILAHIRKHLPTTEIRYQLSYATRPGSAAYLERPTEEQGSTNVDYFFMRRAFERISRWFADHDDALLAAINFYKALTERVYVIWYEAPDDVDSRTLFRRLNVGRIPLTNAELVKAQLLSRIERRDEVAAQWDAIERDLRSPEVWAFATGSAGQSPTHIDLLLDTLAWSRAGASSQPFHTFEVIRTWIAEESANEVWEAVVDLHSLVLGWHEDHDLFHKIGYLVATGSRLRDFVKAGLEMGRHEFLRLLDQRITLRLNLKTDLADLDYEQQPEACVRVLHLMNVETIRRRNDRSHRYSFAAQSARTWTLEHIHAQSAEQLDEVRQWVSWLEAHRDALADLPDVDEARRDALIAEIDTALSTINETTFRQLEGKVIPLFSRSDGSGVDVQAISNLALLEQRDNSALGNAVFEVKRREVLQLDRMGKYIPPATRNVFLKYYTDARGQQLHFWGPQDRDAYLAALVEAVGPYLGAVDDDG